MLLLLLPAPAHAAVLRPTIVGASPRVLPRARALAASDGADSAAGSALATLGSKFEDTLASLQPEERYNAVLKSLLARGRGSGAEAGASAVELVREMSGRRLRVAPESCRALLDATARSDGLPLFLSALSACRANGACRAFASARLSSRPSAVSALAPLPEDSRAAEVSFAVGFSGVLLALGGLEFVDLLDPVLPGETEAPPLWLLAGGLAGVWGFDRYSRRGEGAASLARGLSRLFSRDVTRESTAEAASFVSGYLLGLPSCAFTPTAVRPVELLAAASDALGGAVRSPSMRNADPSPPTGRWMGALSLPPTSAPDSAVPLRMSSAVPLRTHAPATAAVTPVRTRRGESPCTGPLTHLAPLHSPQAGGGQPRLADRVLVWLLSPVAAEVAAYGDVTISRPALAAQFLQAARRREASAGVDVQEGGWGEGEEADEVRLRWAFGEARRLPRATLPGHVPDTSLGMSCRRSACWRRTPRRSRRCRTRWRRARRWAGRFSCSRRG